MGIGLKYDKSATLIDMKVAEAEYFLDKLDERYTDILEINSIVNAFTSSSRNITFSIQYVLADVKGFKLWYSKQQQMMRNDPTFSFFNEYRRASIHEAQFFVTGGTMIGGKISWYFSELKKDVLPGNVYDECKLYFIKILELVYECYMAFKYSLSSKWFYTQEYFDILGKTIDDADEEIMGVFGWTKLNNNDEEIEKRWTVLRNQVIGCEIQHIFNNYLGKKFKEPV
ncbi:MAG: hypothetical protein IIB41_06205 [Candidatus Marinimicrobia bacterium]|nr:hypothetical protein [Candidatus Neomarinimicrobiota bacterium]